MKPDAITESCSIINHEEKDLLPPNAPKLKAEALIIDTKDGFIFSAGQSLFVSHIKNVRRSF